MEGQLEGQSGRTEKEKWTDKTWFWRGRIGEGEKYGFSCDREGVTPKKHPQKTPPPCLRFVSCEVPYLQVFVLKRSLKGGGNTKRERDSGESGRVQGGYRGCRACP